MCIDGSKARRMLVAAQTSLDAAVEIDTDDPQAALEDLLETRMLIATALAALDMPIIGERERLAIG